MRCFGFFFLKKTTPGFSPAFRLLCNWKETLYSALGKNLFNPFKCTFFLILCNLYTGLVMKGLSSLLGHTTAINYEVMLASLNSSYPEISVD